MIIELFVNLKVNDGIIKAGKYDSSKRQFHPALQREIEIHKERGRRTLRIIKEDEPAPSSVKSSKKSKSKTSLKKNDSMNTMDDDSQFTTTAKTSSDATKKYRSRKK